MRHCSFAEAAASHPSELRAAALLEKAGWSDETEMLARLIACLHSMWYDTKKTWEHYLPLKYRDAALYSDVQDQTPEEVRALGQQMDALAQIVQGMTSG